MLVMIAFWRENDCVRYPNYQRLMYNIIRMYGKPRDDVGRAYEISDEMMDVLSMISQMGRIPVWSLRLKMHVGGLLTDHADFRAVRRKVKWLYDGFLIKAAASML